MEWGKPSGLPRLPAAWAATIPEIMMRLEESHHDLICLFEHDLRANAFRVCREGKPVPTFPDHALRDVDLLEDALGADFLGVGGHHGISELFHGVALLERDALELAGLLQRVELDDFLARLQLTAVVTGFLASLEDRLVSTAGGC